MGLVKYKSKRNFKETPEPTGGEANEDQLRFVVQKHDASHLHYDFRLEMEGVLKSWAVPKGPSTDPAVKRLAMMVEDHPYDYRNFEGIIPSGYGAGTVIIWDEGTYEAVGLDSHDKKVHDKNLRAQLYSGKIKFILHGQKLKGEYTLVKTHGRGENSWLLMKTKDAYASGEDILAEDKSVVSHKTLEEVENSTTNFYGAQRVKEGKIKSHKEISLSEREEVHEAAKKNENAKAAKNIASAINAGHPAEFPVTIKPMLATLVDKPFDEPGWLYEIKWDGYRALAFCQNNKTELKSRNDKSFNEKFYPVHKAVEDWNINGIIDGEIVAVNYNGISNFGALQEWRSEADGQLLFYVFDVLWLDGKNLMELPLSGRREFLKSIIPTEGIIRLSENFGDSGIEFFKAAQQMGLEGIIAKRAESLYYPGLRSGDWLKIKANKRQEAIIGGYTRNEGSSKAFSSLLVGVFDKGKLVYTGKIGTGFNDKTQEELLKQFKLLVIAECPFSELPDINKPSRFRPNPPKATAIWIKPELVCEVSFTEMTSEGVMRHPSFEGMRIDKKAGEVGPETEVPTEQLTGKKEKGEKEKLIHGIIRPPEKAERKTFLNPADETQVREVNGHPLKFTNLSKIFWPEEKVTKRDLLNYYYQVAPYILPYLVDRPHSLNRHPNGITGQGFYQKDITGKAPDWIETYLYHSDADDRDRHYLVVKDEASLLYMVSLGCIEINPWSSRIQTPDYPDWCIIDLDPGDKTTFEQVIEAALTTKSVLDKMNVPVYPKTSGSTGMHLYIPLGARYTYEQSKEFARVIVTLVHNMIPGFTSIERAVKDRNGNMYLDFLQNRPQATISSPYSVRPKPGATVSMPLHWNEVKRGLKMKDFTIFNVIDRLKTEGDLFSQVIGKGIDLEKIIADFEKKQG